MTPPNLEGRRFRVVGAPRGDFTDRTIFIFTQRGYIVWAPYAGGTISHGHLLAVMDPLGNLEARWHHVTIDGRLEAGTGHYTVSLGDDFRITYEGPFRIEEIAATPR